MLKPLPRNAVKVTITIDDIRLRCDNDNQSERQDDIGNFDQYNIADEVKAYLNTE